MTTFWATSEHLDTHRVPREFQMRQFPVPEEWVTAFEQTNDPALLHAELNRHFSQRAGETFSVRDNGELVGFGRVIGFLIRDGYVWACAERIEHEYLIFEEPGS